MKTLKNLTLAFLLWIALLSSYCALGQIHIKNTQSFHLAIGNDGVEIETSRNLYIRAGLGIDKAVGAIGLNISDSHDDQWVNHFAVRIGKLYKEPTGLFGLEYGVDKKITSSLFIGGRVYNDWIAKNTGSRSKIGWGIRLGFVL